MRRFALLNYSAYTNECASVHKHDCRDIHDNKKRNGATVEYLDAENAQKVVEYYLDAEMRELGYDASHIKVYPCAL